MAGFPAPTPSSAPFGSLEAIFPSLADVVTPNDEIGLTLMDERLPKRIRSKIGRASGAM